MIGGAAHPHARDQSAHRHLLREGVTGGGDAIVAAFVNAMGPISHDYANSLQAADYHAWLAAAGERVGIEDVLETMTALCRIYRGDVDPLFARAKQASEQIHGARFIALADNSHVRAFVRSGGIMPGVLNFLNEGQ